MSFTVGAPNQSGLDMFLGQLGQGANQGIQDQIKQFNQDKQLDKSAVGLAPMLEEMGFNVEKNALKDILKTVGAKDLFSLVSNLSQTKSKAKELENYNNSIRPENILNNNKLNSGDDFILNNKSSSEEQNIDPNQLQNNDPNQLQKNEEQSLKTKEKIKPILASQQLPDPTSSGQIQQHAQSRIQAKQQGFQQNKKLIESIDSESKKAKEIRPIIKRSAQLAKSGNVGGLKGYVESKLGEQIKFFKSPSVAEFQRDMKELTVQNFRGDFGARPSQSEFFYISDVYPDAADTKEAIMRKLYLEDWKASIKEKRAEIKDKIFEKYGEYPLNLNALIEEGLQPTFDKYLEKMGYNKWIKEQKKEKIPTEDIMLKYLRENNNDPKKAMEAMQRDKYRIIE